MPDERIDPLEARGQGDSKKTKTSKMRLSIGRKMMGIALVILGGVIGIYSWTLRLAARLLEERKEQMIDALRVIR